MNFNNRLHTDFRQKGVLAPFSVGEKFSYSSVAQSLFGSKRFFETEGQWVNTVTAK
jgi:hypothetical protein